MSTTAYSYLRFSSPQQAEGDSLRRQIEERDKWLAAHPDVRLDATLELTDAGRSGFNRKNWDTYALAQFVAHVRSGRVTKGSYLLVENLDRLSRESVDEATEFFLSLTNKGIVIIQLSPSVMEFRKPVGMGQLMFAIVELSRGHSESAIKSERVLKAWQTKHKEAKDKIMTRKLPGWIIETGGKLVLDPEKANTVRRMFALALAGNGASTIARTFNTEGVPVLGRATTGEKGWRQKKKKGEAYKTTPVKWSNVLVHHVLTSRTTVGEFIPYATSGKKDKKDLGEPVVGYYPAVVDLNTFRKVQAELETRRKVGRGRRGKHVNLFAGLLTEARTGCRMSYRHKSDEPPTIIPDDARDGRGAKYISFPAIPFERLLRSRLSEVKASEIVGENHVEDRIATLSSRKTELLELIGVWEAKMDDVKIADRVAAKLGKWETELTEVNAELTDAENEAANPLSQAWGEVATLASLDPDEDTDERRLLIRAGLRRCIESVTCLFLHSKKRVRLAFVRVQFKGKHRTYFLRAEQASHARKVAPPSVVSAVWPDGVGEIDLRKREDVDELLSSLDVSKL